MITPPSSLPTPHSPLPTLYSLLYRLRRFEETVLQNFPRGLFYGTTHTYLGQEANAVGVLTHLQPGDIVFSNHRCHGHFLAYGGEMRALFAELMGKATGVCGGRGGSQHLHWQNFYSNGILGGTVPIATGMALAEKIKGSGAVAIVFLGDGALGEGVVYETLNMASLWGAPILYVVENNRIAQTTPIDLALAGSLPARLTAFGIPTCELDTSNVLDILPVAGNLLAEIRTTQTPRALILHTCRFGPHSKGDDTRPEDEVARMRETRDPVQILANQMEAEARTQIEVNIDREVQEAFEQALRDPVPAITGQSSGSNSANPQSPISNSQSPISTLESLNTALHRAFAADPRVHLIGEDLLDPYGGAFKVTRGLSTQFPDRVHTSPISEAGIMGIATGMALRGLLPIVEIMFGDFTTLIADQLINHAAKFRGMYNDQVRVPLVVRTPMGGRRGYGATHSQTLEKHFLGAPGLRVLAPTALGDPGALLEHAILHDPDPVLFVENKLLYLAKLHTPASLPDFTFLPLPLFAASPYPTYTLTLRDAPPASLTIAAYGYMAELAREAMLKLAYEEEIFTELVVPTQLSPFEMEPMLASVRRTGRLLAVEEGAFTLGWGAEIVARAAEALGPGLKVARRVAAREEPIPAARTLEEATLPGVGDLIELAKRVGKAV
ncbi:MAG: alpha-ketoacid dehydrogenase subunit alpha/beta [Anaerolineales bacterium]